MKKRTFWLEKIEKALQKRSIVWLRGVRRSGKTVLCQSMPGIRYFDCELPDVRKFVENESFFGDIKHGLIALDEVHRLNNPAQLLKIASDHHPGIKIIATGSSSLETIRKFSDTLTGRKTTVFLTPAVSRDGEDFSEQDTARRMLVGGLPPFLLGQERDMEMYKEWIESYWSRDILELFRLEKRESFIRLMELVFDKSGGMFDASRYAKLCEVSRHTVKNHVSVMEATGVAALIRPFSGRVKSEVISMPKIYGFDTGFMTFIKGWDSLRNDDYGILWEHLVLNEMIAVMQGVMLNYWRDKQGHEVDFVIKGGRGQVRAIECKWQSSGFDPANLKIFRAHYPEGGNYVVSHDIKTPRSMKISGMDVRFIGIRDIHAEFGHT